MTIDRYFAEIASQVKRESDRVKIGFSTHALSAGENRENIVAEFLRQYLPKTYGIDSGIILSTEGEFSNQADLVIVDQLNNAPLYPSSSNKLWLVESVYALIEVKTTLSPVDLEDSLKKCSKFKNLKRTFDGLPNLPRINDSLFILWAFNGPSHDTIRENVSSLLKDISVNDQPDFIIIPDSVLVSAGTFRRLSKFGMPDSSLRREIEEKNPGKGYTDIFVPFEFMALNENSLLTWLVWLTSWLKGAGVRSAPLSAYLEKSKVYGNLF